MNRVYPVFSLIIILLLPALSQDLKENADFKLAVSLYNDKLYDLAAEQLRSFINLYPNTTQGIEARFYLALTESRLGNHDDARLLFYNFALTYPENVKSPEAWMNVAEEYAAMKNYREAAPAFERVKTFYPKNRLAPTGLYKAAEYYGMCGDRENMKRVLRSLTQEYTATEVFPARLKLSELLNGEGQYEQARKECKIVADATDDPQLKAQALLLMGRSLAGLGNNQEAESVISEVTQKFSSTGSYYDALFMLGSLKKMSDEREGAASAWQSIISDNSRAPKQLKQDACIEMGEMTVQKGDYKSAFPFFERAGNIDGKRTCEAFYKAGVAAERAGNTSRAAQDYLSAFKDSSGGMDYRAILIGAFKAAVFTKDHREAVAYINLYRRYFPTDENLARLLVQGAGIAGNELDEWNTAIEYCKTAKDQFPGSEWVDDAVFFMGKAKKEINDLEGAIALFENLQKLYPSSPLIPEANRLTVLIRAFNQRSKDVGMQKLALLVGDVISQKSRGNLAYRLGEIYFSDLKDYKLAAEQYSFALSADLEEDLRPGAWQRRAESYEMLALKEGENTEQGKKFLAQAVEVYDSIAIVYRQGDLADKAFIDAFKIRIRLAENPEELQTLGTDFLTRSIGKKGKDDALLLLGDSYMHAGEYENAITTYRLLLGKNTNRDAASAAEYQLGMAYDAKAERDSAIQVLEQFLSKNPNNQKSAAAAAYLAKIAADSGWIRTAVKYADMLAKRYYYTEYNSGMDLLRADVYYNAKDYRNASENYEKVLERLRSDFFNTGGNKDQEMSAVFRLGICYDSLGRGAAAKKLYTEYIGMDQKTGRAGEAYYALASIAKAENDPELAVRYLGSVSRIIPKGDPRQSGISLEIAGMLFEDGKYKDAISRYEEVLAHTKDDSVKKYLQSRIIVSYFRLDDFKEGEKGAAEFAKGKKGDAVKSYIAEFEFERGKFYMRKGDLAKASGYLGNVARLYPKAPVVPEALYWAARVYELDQKLPQAVKLYDSLLDEYPQNKIAPRARLSLGNAYYNLEKWELAAKQYRLILQNEKNSGDLVQFAMNNLIMTYKEVGLFDAALDLTRKYIDRYPDDPDLLDKKIDIGVLYQRLKYYDQSILQLQGLIDAGNVNVEGELRYYIGEAYFYKDDYQQAILEFLKVPYLVARRGKMDWISASYYMAGQSYEKMSNYDKAITMYRQIIERKDTDGQFKAAAQKEIDRVKKIPVKKKK